MISRLRFVQLSLKSRTLYLRTTAPLNEAGVNAQKQKAGD